MKMFSSPEHHAGVLQGLRIPCVIVDEGLRVVYVNQPFLDLFERSRPPEAYLGMDFSDFFYGSRDQPSYIGRCVKEGAQVDGLELEGVTVKGNKVTFRYDASPLRDENGAVIGAFATAVDLTELRGKERDVALLAAFPRQSPHPVLAVGPRGQVVYANPAAKDIVERYGLGGPAGLLPQGHADIASACLESCVESQDMETRVGDRIFTWTYKPIPEENLVHVHAMDVTVIRRFEESLLHNAYHDGLTGLPNRALFLDRLTQALRRDTEGDECLAVMFLDLDRFKQINDAHGHEVGDELLRMAAARIRESLSPQDTLARLGGDEFAILSGEPVLTGEALGIAEVTHRALRQPFRVRDVDFFITASIGVALAQGDSKTAVDLLRDADTAMFRAKALGGGGSAVFDQDMHLEARNRLVLEMELVRAVREKEFTVHYQPIMDLREGKICGFEALARWLHPQRGLVSPGVFIPLAEETGMIGPIGAFVMEEACRQGAAWMALRPDDMRTMSVNLSARQMRDDAARELVAGALASSGLSADRLKVEITESAVMGDVARALETLGALKALGVSLSIDDFGTGYSSLSYLRRFPFDFMKVDRSFVMAAEESHENVEIIRTIVTLAHSLGKEVVAEGVETEGQLALMREMGCEYAQGYLFSKPLPPPEAEAFLLAGKRW